METRTGGSSRIQFQFLIEGLEQKGSTGILRVERGSVVRTITLEDGFVTLLTSNLTKDDVYKIIYRTSGAREQLKKTHELSQQLGVSFTKLLVEQNLLSKEEIKKAEIKRSIEIFDSISQDPEVICKFIRELPPETDAVKLKIRAAEIFQMLETRSKMWLAIHQLLPNLKVRPELTETSKDPAFINTMMSSQRIVYRLIDGKRNAGQIRDDSPISDFETLKVVAFFHTKSWIRVLNPAGTAVETIPAADREMVAMLSQELVSDQSRQASNQAAKREAVKMQQQLDEALDKVRAVYETGDLVRAIGQLAVMDKQYPNTKKIQDLTMQWNIELSKRINELILNDSLIPRLKLGTPVGKELQLSTHEGFLLTRIDSQTRLKYLQTMTSISLPDFRRAIYRLFSLGLINLEAAAITKLSFVKDQGDAGSRGIAGNKFELNYEDLKRRYDRMTNMTYYEILEIRPDASLDKIRENFARLSKTFHPDMYQERETIDPKTMDLMEKLFQIVHTAFRTLTNPDARKQYEQMQLKNKNILMEAVFAATPRYNQAAREEAQETAPARPRPTAPEPKSTPLRQERAASQPTPSAAPSPPREAVTPRPVERPTTAAVKQTDSKVTRPPKAETPAAAPKAASREKESLTSTTISASPKAAQTITSTDLGSGTKDERADARYQKALDAFKTRKYKEAEENLLSALKLNSQNKDYYHQLSLVQLDWGKDLNEAELNAKRAITLDRENPDFFLTLARIYMKKNDPQMAERYYKAAIAWGGHIPAAEKELKELRQQMERGFLKKVMGRMRKK